MQKRTTIKDLSRLLGVSPSTVSRALHDHPDIGAALKQKVRELAAALHYYPNAMASQLRQSDNKTLALIIPEITMFFFPSVIEGITQKVREHGYQLMVLQSHENLQQEIENIKTCINLRVSGIMISLCRDTQQLDHLKEAADMGISIVVFDKTVPNNRFPFVGIDDKNASHKAVSWLTFQGCTQLLGIFGHPHMSISNQRREGFENACMQLLPTGGTFKSVHAYNQEDAALQLRNLWPQFKPNGIFCMSDEVLAGVMPTLSKLNRNNGAACQVIGISDGKLPYLFHEPLHFLQHDGFKIGTATAQCLLNSLQLGGKSSDLPIIIQETPIVSNQQ